MTTCRFTKVVGTRVSLRVYWGGDAKNNPAHTDCPSCLGGGNLGYHNSNVPLFDTPEIGAWKAGGEIADYSDDKWPGKCEHCGLVVPVDATRQIFRNRLWDTPSGALEPGDMYFENWLHVEPHTKSERRCLYWDNCNGPHLMVVLPNKAEWDVDSRASNCDRKDDRTHRCWVRTGEPPDVTAGKGGDTCGAGGGSIQLGAFHGFLRNGTITSA